MWGDIMSKKALDYNGAVIIATKNLPRIDYQCQNPKCNAVLRVRKGSIPCFFAIKSQPHIEDCPYSNSSISRCFLPNDFTIEEFIEMLKIRQANSHDRSESIGENKNEKQQRHPVSTPKQLYDLCIENDILHSEICVDGKTDLAKLLKMAKQGVSGCKVIKGKITRYGEGQFIILTITANNHQTPYLNIKVVMDREVYYQLKEALLKRANRVLEAEVILCAEFIAKNETTEIPRNSGHYFLPTQTTVYISNLSQVYIRLLE